MANYVLAEGVGAPINQYGGRAYISKKSIKIPVEQIVAGNTFDVLYLPNKFVVLGCIIEVTKGTGGTCTFSVGTPTNGTAILSAQSVANTGTIQNSSAVFVTASTLRLTCASATSVTSGLEANITVVGIYTE